MFGFRIPKRKRRRMSLEVLQWTGHNQRALNSFIGPYMLHPSPKCTYGYPTIIDAFLITHELSLEDYIVRFNGRHYVYHRKEFEMLFFDIDDNQKKLNWERLLNRVTFDFNR